ncbi:AmmeMemoRadiSam system radical SAM enzyme [Roseospirillum parvum]|uniref:Pyruvate formate lyase activating enzyme n=1 Tax=Roseospirillum parvum TaxID=83401 RepID=A0A1G7U613_9PROT|nr:AmmeMemoRadiSam system radical SAM enzyme [Roseospirillum parvum]SDG42711.1 pyruvate formate lyase activating enzyme [Roseospirillum parvum]
MPTSTLGESTHPAEFWHAETDGRLRCELCPRACLIAEGQRGLCFVRANRGGRMVLTTYGRSSGFCIDPIEKKPLNHFLPGTPVLSFGTAGCNLTCRFCQNHDISKVRAFDRLQSPATPQAIARAAVASDCRSVAYTYNDPVIFLEYARDTARACRELGLFNVAVTAGYIEPAARPALFTDMDAANVDLKGFTEGFYRKLATASLAPVLDTLRYLVHETPVWVEITTLLIPGHNDGDDEVQALAAWVAETLGPDVPLHFSAFHPDFRMRDTPRTPPSTLRRARALARRCGLNFVYTGNVHDPEGDATPCPVCQTLLIERDWYQLTGWRLDPEGRCPTCHTPLPGRFEPTPGTWGARRQRLAV